MGYTMMISKLSGKIVCVALVLAVSAVFVVGQRAGSPTPRQERLLNGLKVLIWNDPSARLVTARLRIHSGASFDPQGKEGVMRMLAESFFPTDIGRSFFREELGGELQIETNYDFVEFKASSTPAELLTLLESLASAVTNPTLDKEAADAARAIVLPQVEAILEDPAYVADRAAAERLFGTFPYGRPEWGTPETLSKIDFADLVFAYERFFGADNTTLTISGNIDGNLAYRAVRRYFGGWSKLYKRVPHTFRQPDVPETSIKLVDSPVHGVAEVRYAVRGGARGDKDFVAYTVYSRIIYDRLTAKTPAEMRKNVFVRHRGNILPGMILIGVSDIPANAISDGNAGPVTRDAISATFAEPVTEAEFIAAKASVRAEYGRWHVTDLWLNADTYRIASVKAEQDAYAGVSLADVQRAAELIRSMPMVSVRAFTPVEPQSSTDH
jgi:zinc protease